MSRLKGITPIGVDRMGNLADQSGDGSILRLENLDSEMAGYPVVKPLGGWSLLMDCAPLGLSGEEVSKRLLERGRIAATAMTGWGGPRSADFIRLVFSNEPAERLSGMRARVDAAIKG